MLVMDMGAMSMSSETFSGILLGKLVSSITCKLGFESIRFERRSIIIRATIIIMMHTNVITVDATIM